MWEMLGAPNNEFKNIKEHKKSSKSTKPHKSNS